MHQPLFDTSGKILNGMTMGVQRFEVEGIFFFQPPKERFVKGLWNVNKLFQGFWDMPVVLHGPHVKAA